MDYKQSTLALRVENIKAELETIITQSLASGARKQVYWNFKNLLEELETEIVQMEDEMSIQ